MFSKGSYKNLNFIKTKKKILKKIFLFLKKKQKLNKKKKKLFFGFSVQKMELYNGISLERQV